MSFLLFMSFTFCAHNRLSRYSVLLQLQLDLYTPAALSQHLINTTTAEGFPSDDLRKISPRSQQMANVPNGTETLRKISITWVGHTNITDRRQTNDRRMDD